jgi:hypothetical protein
MFAPGWMPAQVTLQGSQTSVRFNTESVGQTSAAQSLQFTVKAGTNLGAVEFLSSGFAGTEFVDAGGSTCVAGVYASDTTCTVNVAFHPAAPGWRDGGLVIQGLSIYLYGYGSGAQAAFLPPATTILASDSTSNWFPNGITTDSLGNAYVYDARSGNLIKFAVDGTQSVAFAGIQDFAGMAIDGVGNFYQVFTNFGYAPPFGGFVLEFSLVTGQGGNYVGNPVDPVSLSVDGAGNIYIGDDGFVPDGYPPGPEQLVKIATNGSETVLTSVNQGNWLYPTVDSFGNIYTQDGNAQVYKYSPNAAGVYTQTAVYPATGLTNPSLMAVDGGGNAYFVAFCTSCGDTNGRLIELTPTGQQLTLYSGSAGGFILNSDTYFIAVDGNGNIFLPRATDATQQTFKLVKFSRGAPAKLGFATPTAGGSTDVADGAQAATLQNIGNSALDIYAVRYPKDFPSAPGAANVCAAGTVLKSNTCQVAVNFAPTAVNGTATTIPLQENIGLTTNASAGLPDPLEAITVSGTETKRAPKVTVTSSNRFPTVGSYVIFSPSVQGTGTTPTGTVALAVGEQEYNLPLTGGKAMLQTAQLPVGTTTISAAYPGDAVYAAGNSPSFGQTVSKATTTVALAASKSTAAKGSPVTFRATISTVGFNPPPTGTVTFFSGSTSFASSTLSGGAASVTTSSLPAGTDSIKVIYSGDGLYNGAVSAVVTEMITP